MSPFRLQVNGVECDIDVEGSTTLLSVLRDQLGLTGTKDACGRGECGACTVLVGDLLVLSCLTLAARVDDEVVTVEGLSASDADLRRAFADEGGFQCGFCTPGQIVSAAALLRDPCSVTPPEVRIAMAGNICRCTGYAGIAAAIEETARRRGGQAAPRAGDLSAAEVRQ
jgi:aerobic-type carbon monoxide dehydrogenase small subunit (CoxS/CutS family)